MSITARHAMSHRRRPSPATDTLGLTSGLAEDAAEILERDYDIDAGEVLSMNIDTVETQTSSKVTESASAEEIAANYRCEEWNHDYNVDVIAGAHVTSINDFQSGINEWFAISDTLINGKTRPTIQLKKQGVRPYKVFIDAQNYVTVTQGTDFSAEYETYFGATNLTGSTGVCGEAAYWFKLTEDSKNGYGIVFDNHGPSGCGFFNNNNNTLYFVKMVNGLVSAVDYNNYVARFVDYAQYPEYKIKVTETNGKASIEISPANSTAGLIDKAYGGSDRLTTPNSNVVKWDNLNVAMYETPFTQAYGFYDFGGLYFADSSVTMERTVTKSFGDIVYEPEWTDGALHMLINMDTKADSTMLGTDGGRHTYERFRGRRAMPCFAGTGPRPRRPRRRSRLSPATDTLGLTSGLAEDAAEILERDYDIDAGEVLSMNIDTVETASDTSQVSSDDADVILGKNGKEATWGVYNFPVNGNGKEGFNYNAAPPTTSGTISSAWDIADRTVQEYVTDSDGNTTLQNKNESVVLLRNSISTFQFLRNDAQWQYSRQNDEEGKFLEATYSTVIGGDTNLQGTENLNACGEAWWFFKLNEANTEGYAIGIDNHGYRGCGIFTRWWNQLYVVHYDWNNPIKEHVPDEDNTRGEAALVPYEGSYSNVTILKKWRVSPLQVSPRYQVTVREKDGKATITVDPDELNAPYSYIDGEQWPHDSFFIGYEKGSEHTQEHNNAFIEGIETRGNQDAEARLIASEYYRNKENYDWDWPGCTQDSVSCTIDLSESIQNVKTTQAFSAYNWNGTYFANNTVDVKRQVTKSFGDIVYEPEWTDGALHMLINMDTKADSTMLGSDGVRLAGCHAAPPAQVQALARDRHPRAHLGAGGGRGGDPGEGLRHRRGRGPVDEHRHGGDGRRWN